MRLRTGMGVLRQYEQVVSVKEQAQFEEELMGIFDKMFGSGAQGAQDATSQKRFEELKQKYQSVLRSIEQQHIQLQNLHVENNKLFIKGTAPSEQAKNKIWDEIKLVNPNADDITADFNVAQGATQAAAAGASAGGGQSMGGQKYTVRSGDSLSKISQEFYGNAHDYMRIFYANKDKISDPNKIQPGMELTIPSAEAKS
ncbi:MAG TPA: LysM peptidoglycan-binding domain-containing protein [Candidatus Acidoferrum sp.]